VADWTYHYSDDFNTDKVQTDSYDHCVFWPEMAFPPNTPYLYLSSTKGNPAQGLVFVGFEDVPAHLSYSFPVPSSPVALNRGVSGMLRFDVQFPFGQAPPGYLMYFLSSDGSSWTSPTSLAEGHHQIAVSSASGTCYISFVGTEALIDNVDASLAAVSADIHVPGDYGTIQEAIDAASGGQVIEVAAGIYTGDGNRDIEFRGKPITVRSAAGPENTIIDCNNPDGLVAHRGFYFHEGEGPESVVRGFTIRLGTVPGSEIPTDDVPWVPEPGHPIGGGIYCELSSPTIVNCIVAECGTEIGGGIGCVGGAPAILSCTVENCTAGGFGAAEFGGSGGGIAVIRGGSPKIVNCTVRNNLGPDNSRGGGIYCRESSPQIMQCRIYGNNTAGSGTGGGLYCGPKSDMILQNCLIFQNGTENGSGIMAESNNESPLSRIVVDHCTIAHNYLHGLVVPSAAGGIFADRCDIRARNSIVWFNDHSQIELVDPTDGSPVVYCDVQHGYPGHGNIDENPLFADIGLPMAPDYHLQSLYGRYHPLSGHWVSDPAHSPGIDAGDPADPAVQEPVPNGNRVNMGAYGQSREASKSYHYRVYHVDAANGNDGNTGLSRSTAFKTIQQGVNAANESDVVLLWPGVYREQVNFVGKAITVQSAHDPAVVETTSAYAFSFYTAEGRRSVLRNVIIRNSQYAIFCNSASPTISNLTIVENVGGIDAQGGAAPDIANCIFWNNTNGDLRQCQARYSRLEDVQPQDLGHNISDDPLFADPDQGDYHLLSERGRFLKLDPNDYNTVHGFWVLDEVSSPCIDGGDPAVIPLGERMPNGARLNMGAYGGTAFASMSEWPIAGDVNRDGVMNLVDLAILLEDWLRPMPWAWDGAATEPGSTSAAGNQNFETK
jgi:hypothetical protein